ncbi:MAG: hypothetical protein GXP32_07965 [Kiritimatiellaeota bacterium]|nr:hypothetical protein [Kiritimatiellota bacterium]
MGAISKSKRIALVLDNVSYHKCAYVREKIELRSNIILKYPPTYSPEYNPVEQVWRRLKPLVYGTSSIAKGVVEFESKIRKTIWHWQNDKLSKPLNIGFGLWNNLIINIYGS